MRIVLTDTENRFDDKFLNYLKTVLRDKFFELVNYRKLLPFEIFINGVTRYKSLLKKYISSSEICNIALYNIKVTSTTYSHTLEIDAMATIPNTTIKIKEICSLIDDGNLYLKAYPIFTETFQYVQTNIEEIYAKYALGEKNVHKTL